MKTTLTYVISAVMIFSATLFYMGMDANQEKIIEPAEISNLESPIVNVRILHQPDTSTKKIETTIVSNNPFQTAVDEIAEMLNGKKPLSFKRAVFLTENAYYDGNLNWQQFCNEIEKIKVIVNKMIVEKGLQKYKTAGNWAIFSYMTEKISDNNYSPFQYDFDNFMGDTDYESFMVSSLLRSRKGNCHSLPYLYKILADEVNVEAFIATAPMHVFIKHKDEKGQWWNLELTSGTFSRTSFIIESFNVSDAGMESGLYLKPLSNKESLALCLSDLIEYYEKKTGHYFGDIVYKAYTEGLKVYPNSILQLVKRDEIKYRLDKEMEKYGFKEYDDIKSHPNLIKLYDEIKSVDEFIQNIGYSTLTPDQYRDKVRQIEAGK